MSDIDFVELDKAVNNLTNKNNQAAEVKRTEQPPQQPKGRFMDVFHHSSDMMTKDHTVLSSEKAEPSAHKVVTPLNPSMTRQPKPVTSPYTDTPSSSDAKPEPAATNDWPDPIEVAQSHGSETLAASVDSASPKATSTLFLPDTKVEKRPLGGFSGENIQTDEDKTPQLGDEKIDQLEPAKDDPVAATAALPPELRPDLVAIEERETESAEEPHDVQPENIHPSETPVPEIKADSSQDHEPAPPKRGELSGLLASGSIPQQYKTTDEAQDSPEVTHPIFFDADQYSKAPDPGAAKKPHKKTSAFQWIFIIVGLLLLGATLAAAVFVYVVNK